MKYKAMKFEGPLTLTDERNKVENSKKLDYQPEF